MKNTESVARSFEKAADQLENGLQPFGAIAESIDLRARLRERASQVRAGQQELDRAKQIIKESQSR